MGCHLSVTKSLPVRTIWRTDNNSTHGYKHQWIWIKTRTPASEMPPATVCLPILVIHIRSQVKTRQSQSYKFQKLLKFQILQETLHATHLLKLLDKMYKYEMDPTRIVGATERTRDARRMDRKMDGRMDRVKPIYPQQLHCVGGYNNTEMSFKKMDLTELPAKW